MSSENQDGYGQLKGSVSLSSITKKKWGFVSEPAGSANCTTSEQEGGEYHNSLWSGYVLFLFLFTINTQMNLQHFFQKQKN